MNLLLDLFGTGKDLSAGQICARAVVVFFAVLVLMRISGRRSFGQRTPFDQVVVILLGATASRAIVGVSPFLPTMAATLAIVVLHRALARLAVAFPALDTLVNGRERLIFEAGRADAAQMRKALVTEHDLVETARLNGEPDLAAFERVTLERSGEISVLRKR